MNTQIQTEQSGYNLLSVIIPRISSAITIIVGVSVFIGWMFFFWIPKDYLVLVASIKPNSAICFILVGFALWIRNDKSNRFMISIAEIASAFVFLFSFLTLLEYFFKINLGIDQSLFSDPNMDMVSSVYPGRMSPFIAMNFVIIGLSLFFLDNNVISYRVLQLFIIFVVILSLFEFLTHIYAIENIFITVGIADKQSAELAAPSALLFLLLGIGVLFARPDRGITSILVSYDSGGTLARRFIPLAIIIPIILGYIGIVGLAKKWVGFYEAEFGVTLLVMGTILLFTVFILVQAYLIDQVDIKRKFAENALKLNQAQLQAILNHTNAMICIYDLEGKYILVNNAFTRKVHKSIREIIGKNAHDIFPVEIANKFKKNNEIVIQTRKSIAVEENIPNDHVNTYISNIFPLFDDQNIPYAVGEIATDISHIKQIEASHQANEERLVLALQSAATGTWSWNILEDVLEWDASMLALFGIKSILKPRSIDAFFNFIHPDDRKKIRSEFAKCLKNVNQELDCEFRIIRKNGDIQYISSKGKIYRDKNNKPVRMMGVCSDVTAYKHAEKELLKAKEIAEEMAKKAEYASNAKSSFLAAMSHEIRTPLNGVIVTTKLLTDTKLTAEQRECLEIIRISGEALLSVINDILDFSKIESERMELENVDFDLQAIVMDTVEVTAAYMNRKKISFGAWIDPGVPQSLKGDPNRIRQILANLLSNAAKFTERGEISVRIKLLKKEKNIITLLFEVNDTGIGITPEVREKLFMPFSQGDISTARKFGGTGLGLAISKRLVEMMKGTIGVDSLFEKGCRFWFTIVIEESTTPLKKIEYEIIPELIGKRILCVDDSSINREIIKNQADTIQLQCDLAVNAAEALAMLTKASAKNEPYDLALIDYEMPDMDGGKLIEIIRQLKEIANTRIIVMSSLGTNLGTTFLSESLKKLDVSLVLPKPIRPEKFYESITTILKGPVVTIEKWDDKKPEVNTQELKKNRVLLAEDNPINQFVAIRILEKLGYAVDIAANGFKVLEAIKNVSYDLILMDCQMPEMDGYTTTQKIRKMESDTGKHIPIIAMTAHVFKSDREECITVGMDDYISKPIDAKELETLLNKWTTSTVNIEESATNQTISIEKNNFTESVNMQRMYEIFGNDNAAIHEFIKNYVDSTAILLKELNDTIKQKNAKAAMAALHQLSGSAANSGIMQIHMLSKQAEEEIKQKSDGSSEWNTVETLYNKIQEELEHLQYEINNHHL